MKKYFEQDNTNSFAAQDILHEIVENSSYQSKNWMETYKEVLNKKPLCKIILPGAHDAGAYGFNRKSKVGNLPKFIEETRKFIQWLPGDGYLTRWSKTQELTIKEQLEVGIRYFDLRVSQSKDRNFYLYHGLQGPNLELVLQAFHDFLRDNKGEILILDMSHFFNVSHDELLKLINKYLVEFCATKSDITASVTYEELIRKNKRCLIYYDEKDFANKNKFLLGTSDSYWANERKIEKLKNSLKDYHSNRAHSSPWVFQYVLTPNAGYIIKHPLKSVKHLAKITHEHMDEVLNDCKQSFPLNIVMFDFVD